MKLDIKKIFCALTILSFSTILFAADSSTGGLPDVKEGINKFTFWLYTIVGAVASAYMLVYFILVKLEKKRWADFFMELVWVGVAAGIIFIVPAVWNWGRSTFQQM